jgi:hypothetical protein
MLVSNRIFMSNARESESRAARCVRCHSAITEEEKAGADC